MPFDHRSTIVSRTACAKPRVLLRGGLLALVMASVGGPARADYPSAQDVVALIEVVAVECVRLQHLKPADVEQMRRNMARHFRRATYAQYLASPPYERTAKLMRADIAKDRLTPKFCDGMRSFGTAEPDNLIFAERGLDYPAEPEPEPKR